MFLVGMLAAGFGVAFSADSMLGNSPISSFPYVLAQRVGITLGGATVVFNVLFLILQALLLRSRFRLQDLLQLPAVVLFGVCIDLGGWVCSFLTVDAYPFRFGEMLFGCGSLAFGIALQLFADIAILPGDGLVRAIAKVWKWPFGRVKVCVDSSMVALAIVSSLVWYGTLVGVREGTLIAAVLVGLLIRRLQKPLRPVKKLLCVPR